MYAEIKLKTAEGGERTVGMMANAAIPIRYRNIFRKDLMADLTKMISDPESLNADAMNGITDMVPQLAFVMAMAADKRDMKILSYEMFIEWMEQFSAEAFTDKSAEIIGIYFGNTGSESEAKN